MEDIIQNKRILNKTFNEIKLLVVGNISNNPIQNTKKQCVK